MLSPGEGQELAQIAGFSPPSKDVSDIEFVDTVAKWTVMALAGALEVSQETAKWMSSFLSIRNSMTEDETKGYETIFYGYSAALIGLLMDQGLIDISVNPDEESPVSTLSSMLSLIFTDEDDDEELEDE